MSRRRDWNRGRSTRRGHWSTRTNREPQHPAWKDREPMLMLPGTLAEQRRARAAAEALKAIKRKPRRRTAPSEASMDVSGPKPRSRRRRIMEVLTGE